MTKTLYLGGEKVFIPYSPKSLTGCNVYLPFAVAVFSKEVPTLFTPHSSHYTLFLQRSWRFSDHHIRSHLPPTFARIRKRGTSRDLFETRNLNYSPCSTHIYACMCALTRAHTKMHTCRDLWVRIVVVSSSEVTYSFSETCMIIQGWTK
jgi:hypothetical protein